MEIKYGFLVTKWEDDDGYGRHCDDEKCNRGIQVGAECFVDTEQESVIYCKLCGPCVRYARKKEKQREEEKNN